MQEEQPSIAGNNNSNNGTKKQRFPRGYWQDRNNHRRFLEDVAKQLGINALDDWYTVTIEEVRSRGGRALINNYYGASLSRALQELYPEHPWDASRFAKTGQRFWKQPENQRRFFDELGRELQLSSLDDWYNVRTNDVLEREGGYGLLSHYGYSLARALCAVYPEHNWDPTRFLSVPVGHWQDIQNQRKLFDMVGAEQLGVRQLDDWYGVKLEHVKKQRKCDSILKNYYGGSLQRALKAIYPEHNWDDAKFPKPRNYWKDPNHQRELLEQIGRQLGVEQLDDWYKVKQEDTYALGAKSMLQIYHGSSLARALKTLYPEHNWQPAQFSKVGSGHWQIPENQRKLFDEIARQLGLKELDDWYTVRTHDVFSRGGSAVLSTYYKGSLARALQAIYPEHNWRRYKFDKVSQGYWKDPQHQRQFLDEVGSELGISKLDDWYNVKTEDLQSRGGTGLLRRYGGSLIRTLQAVYPQHKWRISKFTRTTKGYWNDVANCRQFFDEVAEELGVRHLDDWLEIKAEQVIQSGGRGVLRNYDYSLSRALRAAYPEHNWQFPPQATKVAYGYWNDINNQRQFFDEVGNELGIKQLDDWYKVRVQDVSSRGGRGLLHEHYGGSLARALETVYPDHSWDFGNKELNLLEQRQLLERIGREFNVSALDDWYNVKSEEFKRGSNGRGAALLRKYGGSMIRALQALYPKHNWQVWKFSAAPLAKVTRANPELLQQYLDALAQEFKVEKLDDWYRVSTDQIRKFGGYTIIGSNGGLPMVLMKLYPGHSWDISKFASSKKAAQRWLALTAAKIFPHEEVLEDFLHPELQFEDSTVPMELDVYIPSLSLAFEYQGEQHFRDVHMFGPQAKYKYNDSQKTLACQKAGITLVIVPYWWDQTAASLIEAILPLRPDLRSLMPITTTASPSAQS